MKYHTVVVGYTPDGYYGPVDAGHYNTLEEAIRFQDLDENILVVNYYVYDENGNMVYPVVHQE